METNYNKPFLSVNFIKSFLSNEQKKDNFQNQNKELQNNINVYKNRVFERSSYIPIDYFKSLTQEQILQQSQKYKQKKKQEYLQKKKQQQNPNQKNQKQQQNNNSNNNFKKNEISEEELKKKQELEKNQNQFLEEMIKKNQMAQNKILSKIRFALNILAPDNYLKIRDDVLQNIKQDEVQDCKQNIVEMLIKKALEDVKYSNTFADLFNYIFQEEKAFQKLILMELQALFEGKKQIHPQKKPFSELEKDEIENFLRIRKRKFLQLGVLLGNFFRMGVIPSVIIQGCLTKLLGNFIEGYDYFLYLKKQNKSEDLEKDYSFEDYLELLVVLLERGAGKKLDERHKNKLKSSKYNDELRQENFCIQDLKESLIRAQNNPLDSDLDEITFLQDRKISIDGVFKILDLCYNGDQQKKQKKYSDESIQDQQQEQEIQKKLDDIVGVRIQTLIINLKERRGNQWEERVQVKDNTAKTKEQVLKEVEEDKIRREQALKQQKNNENESDLEEYEKED